MTALTEGNITLELVKKPFKDFTIDVRDISASTGYTQEIDSYTKDTLEYLGEERVLPENFLMRPGSAGKLSFKFKPLIRDSRPYVVIKTCRSGDPGSASYKAFVITFE